MPSENCMEQLGLQVAGTSRRLGLEHVVRKSLEGGWVRAGAGGRGYPVGR